MRDKKIRTRIAPSPTGDPHVGTAYIALFNLAYAKKNMGDFILRIEDTDRTRSTKESETQIFEALQWLGLNYDEGPDYKEIYGPYRQSERFEIYKEHAEKLVNRGTAYHCFCSHERLEELRERQKTMKKAPGYDGHCRGLSKEEVERKLSLGESSVIRLKMPYEGKTVINDIHRGAIEFENSLIDDQILLKADGYPTYHLANVVDDYLMKITHVIRAEEWIASTPKHIQLYKAFGWEAPEFIHMPLLRNDDKTKISKRKNPTSLIYYKENGYLKEAMINFLGLMGYNIGENEQISMNEFIEAFDITKVRLGGPVFDLTKLKWINNQYMRKKDLDELVELSIPFFLNKEFIKKDSSEKEINNLKKIISILREGSTTLKEMAEVSSIYYIDDFVLGNTKEEMESLCNTIKNNKGLEGIKLFLDKLNKLNEEITEKNAKDLLHDILAELNEKPNKILMPLRLVLTGKSKGGELYNIVSILGKHRTINRIINTCNKYNININ